MSENTHLAEQEESATRIAELSGALETMTGNRDDAVTDMNAMFVELEACRGLLREANTVVGRLRLHLSQGVEL